MFPRSVLMVLVVFAADFAHAHVCGPLTNRQLTDELYELKELKHLPNKLIKLEDKLDALEERLNSLSSSAADEQTVAFTARFSASQITGLGPGQTLKFDNVMHNAGSGYNSTTGFFTAPVSGTYFFAITVLRYSDQDNVSEIGLYKGDTALANAYACCSQFASATGTATVHLNKGETTHVRMVGGSMLYGQRITTFSGMRISPN